MILQGNVYSTALDMETTVCFVAANNFSKEPPRKVCYLLHGLQGRADNFINYTMLADWCRSYHVLFVLPDGQRSYYTDMVRGQKFFTYLTQDLPHIVRDVFRVSAAPEDTYIMGTSMGGYGALKAALTAHGYTLVGDEPLKVTLATKGYGYRGDAVAAYLEEQGMVCEFADPDYCVMMFSTAHTAADFDRVERALCALSRAAALTDAPPSLTPPVVAMSPRRALFAPAETLPVADCIGRVLASPTVGCPPAVPVLVGGEVVDQAAARVFAYYGYGTLRVVKE